MLGRKIIHKEVLDSTNNYIAKLILEDKIEHGTVILADIQTEGRGQRGAKWDSEPFSNLIFSCFLKHDNFSVREHFFLSQCVSNACVDFLNDYHPGFQIKWPNDLVFLSKKIGGILIENSLGKENIKHSIVGIGLNINQKDFGDYNALSLLSLTGKTFNIQESALKLIEKLNYWYALLQQKQYKLIQTHYLNHLWLLNNKSLFQKGEHTFTGEIKGISDSGELVILSENGLEHFKHKEIVFLERKNPS